MSKRVTAEQLAESAWQAALAPKSEPEAIPDGWLTAAQIAKLIGKNRNTASKYLCDAIRDGRAEMKKFRVPAGQRGLYPTPHYRLTK